MPDQAPGGDFVSILDERLIGAIAWGFRQRRPTSLTHITGPGVTDLRTRARAPRQAAGASDGITLWTPGGPDLGPRMTLFGWAHVLLHASGHAFSMTVGPSAIDAARRSGRPLALYFRDAIEAAIVARGACLGALGPAFFVRVEPHATDGLLLRGGIVLEDDGLWSGRIIKALAVVAGSDNAQPADIRPIRRLWPWIDAARSRSACDELGASLAATQQLQDMSRAWTSGMNYGPVPILFEKRTPSLYVPPGPRRPGVTPPVQFYDQQTLADSRAAGRDAA